MGQARYEKFVKLYASLKRYGTITDITGKELHIFMKKERIDAFDFMRSATAWIIVIYHFACICNTTPQYGNFPLFYTHANGVWGENTSVNVFFMLSGASLYYNYPAVKWDSAKRYYFTRFKGLFPMFYMIWFFLYYQKATTVGNLFYNGSPKSMLLTLGGMDGYLSYRYPQNYYFIGEWFLGALVFLYLLYPLLTWCMKHCRILTTLLLGAGTLSFHWPNPYFQIQRERNLIVCMLAFWLGMLFIEYRKWLENKWVAVFFGGIALVFIFVKVPIDPFLCAQAIAVGLFLLFYHAGNFVMGIKRLKPFFIYTGGISYAIFLLQHVVMSQVIGLFGSYELTILQESVLLVVTFVMIYLFADVCTRLNKIMLQSKWFGKIQKYFI